MSEDSPTEPLAAAVDHLKELGLSSYAARTYVALATLGSGTARDVSRVVDVPRTRVYDAAEELQNEGLVDVRQSSPREFWAVSAETACRKFERETARRTNALVAALNDVGPVDERAEQRGVWAVTGQQTVTERIEEFFGAAQEEIVFMTVEELLDEELLAALSDASDRGVSIRLGGISSDVEERLTEELPEAELFESLWAWSDTPAARLAMIDGDQTLVSALVQNGDPAGRRESAIWGEGETNSLVAVLKAIFTWRLRESEPDDTETR